MAVALGMKNGEKGRGREAMTFSSCNSPPHAEGACVCVYRVSPIIRHCLIIFWGKEKGRGLIFGGGLCYIQH